MSIATVDALRQLIGLRCEAAKYPYGFILSIDFGTLARRRTDRVTAEPHGWRHLTVLCPRRVQTAHEIVFDWNVDGGPAAFSAL